GPNRWQVGPLSAGAVRPRGVSLLVGLIVGLLAPMIGARPAAAWIDPPDPGSTHTFTYQSGSNAYPYIVYVPTSYHPGHHAPLVVMTHGCETTAEQQMRANLYN